MNSLKRMINIFLRRKSLLNILIKNGLTVGENFFMNTGCIIDFSHCWLIKIGDNVTLGPYVKILAHDASTKHFLDYTKIAKVNIGNNVFIGAGSIIFPGVSIGDNVVVGAGSLVTKSIPANKLAYGSPAKEIMNTDEYINSIKQEMNVENTFSESYTLRSNISLDKKIEMNNSLTKYSIGFVK